MSSVIQEILEEDIVIDQTYIRARVADWQVRVSHLFDEIVSWCPSLSSDRSDTVTMDEEMMRKFDVGPVLLPVLRLSNREQQIGKFVPHGLWVIGTNGRVNMFTASERFVIIDRSEYGIPARWEIAPSLRRLETEPLSEAALSRSLR